MFVYVSPSISPLSVSFYCECIISTISIASATQPIVSFEVHYHPKFPSSCNRCALLSDESNRLRLTTDPSCMPEARSAVVNESYAMTPQDAKANRERKRKWRCQSFALSSLVAVIPKSTPARRMSRQSARHVSLRQTHQSILIAQSYGVRPMVLEPHYWRLHVQPGRNHHLLSQTP